MSGERPQATIITQVGYGPEMIGRNLHLGGRIANYLESLSRRFGFGAIPHYGAYILAAYLVEAGYQPNLVGLNDP